MREQGDDYLNRLGVTEAELRDVSLALRKVANKIENRTGHRPMIRFDGFTLHIDAREESQIEFAHIIVQQ